MKSRIFAAASTATAVLAGALVLGIPTAANAAAGDISITPAAPTENQVFTVTSSCLPSEDYAVIATYEGGETEDWVGIASDTGAVSVELNGPVANISSLDFMIRVVCDPGVGPVYAPPAPENQVIEEFAFDPGNLGVVFTPLSPAPNGTVFVTGSGCAAGESVLLSTWDPIHGHVGSDLVFNADGAGNFADVEIPIPIDLPTGEQFGVVFYCGGVWTNEPFEFGRAFADVGAVIVDAPDEEEVPDDVAIPDPTADEGETLAETGPEDGPAGLIALLMVLLGAALLVHQARPASALEG